MKKCRNCLKTVHGHPNKKFCNARCKDHYHNRTNPRGYGRRRDLRDAGPDGYGGRLFYAYFSNELDTDI